MGMFCVAEIDGVEQLSDQLELGVFCGDECRASAMAQAFTIQGTLLHYLFIPTVAGEDGHQLTFKLYDHSISQELDLIGPDPITFQEDGYGAPINPFVVSFTSATLVTQTVELVAGWNWFSTYIDVEGNNIFDQLKAGLGTSGLQITSQGNGASTYRNGRWVGNVTIKNESGYKIKTSAPVTFTITGSQYADPAECPITIKPGWNWIGYPVSEPQTVATALAGFPASNNDQIKTLGGGATYRSGRWLAATYTLVPGKSYAYKSNASVNKTLLFPNVESTAKSEPTE